MLGTRIREVRKDRGLSLRQLGKAIGRDKSTVLGIERVHRCNSSTLERICIALKVRSDYLLFGVGPKTLSRAAASAEAQP